MSLQDDLRKNEQLLRFYLKRWRNYALSFHIEALQAEKFWYPTFQQYELCKLRDRNDNIAISAGRGVGKSSWEAGEVWRHLVCMKLMGIPCKVLITGPSGGQLEDVIMAEIAAIGEHLLPWIRDKFTQTKEKVYCVENPDNWFASPRTARKESPTSVQGQHGVTLNIMDEGTGIHDEIFRVITTGTTHEHSYSIVSGNPDRLSGYFYRIFNKFRGERWAKYFISCLDCQKGDFKEYPYIMPNGKTFTCRVEGIVTTRYIEDQRDEHGEGTPAWSSYVLGKFPTEESNQLIKRSWVELAWGQLRGQECPDRKRIMGVDCGHESDPSAYAVRKGTNIEEVDQWRGLDPIATADRVIGRWMELDEADRRVDIICVDPIGIGDGVVSYLRKWDREVLRPKGLSVTILGVKASEVAPSSGTACRRMRDWLWWQARNFFRDQKPYFCEDTKEMRLLAEELTLPMYQMPQGRWIVVDDKDTIKKKGFASPNIADALNMTFKADFKNPLPKMEIKVDPYRKSMKKRKHNKKNKWKVA